MVLFVIFLAIVLPLIFVSYHLMRWVWTNIEEIPTTTNGDCLFFLFMSVLGFWFIIPWFGIRIMIHTLPFSTKLSQWMKKEVK